MQKTRLWEKKKDRTSYSQMAQKEILLARGKGEKSPRPQRDRKKKGVCPPAAQTGEGPSSAIKRAREGTCSISGKRDGRKKEGSGTKEGEEKGERSSSHYHKRGGEGKRKKALLSLEPKNIRGGGEGGKGVTFLRPLLADRKRKKKKLLTPKGEEKNDSCLTWPKGRKLLWGKKEKGGTTRFTRG